METKTQYQCSICKTWYQIPELAQSCEASGTPAVPPDIKVGQEVNLKNRNVGYTVAVVRELRLGAGSTTYAGDLPDMTQEQYQKIYHWWEETTQVKDRHEWQMVLDRKVCLDHKWEEDLDTLPLHYILSESQISTLNLQRNDNHCW